MDCKAIFFDLDGTLADLKTHKVPHSAKEALRLAKDKGIRLFLATGRHPMQFRGRGIIDDISFDGFITSNGQYCYDNNGEVIHITAIPRADKVALVEQLKANPYPVTFTCIGELYINMIDERVKKAHEILDYPLYPIKDPGACLDHDILVLLLYGDASADTLPLSVMPGCRSLRWNNHFTDIVPAHGGKDKGIDAVAQFYNIPINKTISFGDAQNDLTMLRRTGLGIAMGNASQEVKEAAGYVTESACDNGIFNALRHLGVI